MSVRSLQARLEGLGVRIRQLNLIDLVESVDLWFFPAGWTAMEGFTVFPGAMVSCNPAETVSNQTSVTVTLAWGLESVPSPDVVLCEFGELLPAGGKMMSYAQGEVLSTWYGAGRVTETSYQYGDLDLRAVTRFDVLIDSGVTSLTSGVLLQRTYHTPMTCDPPVCRPLDREIVDKLLACETPVR